MKKIYQFGDILITATYTNNFTNPAWDDKNYHPEYIITIREAGNKTRHSVKAWGNIADAPDTQHQSLAGLVLQEHFQEVGSFREFCQEFGYDEDSRKAETIWKQLKTCYKDGYWLKLCRDSHAFKLWQKSGEDLEQYLIIVKH